MFSILWTVCSADGTMTVVATPGATWPSVQPERTSLLDRTCKPKQTSGARVLFEFKLNSCGTKATVRLAFSEDAKQHCPGTPENCIHGF